MNQNWQFVRSAVSAALLLALTGCVSNAATPTEAAPEKVEAVAAKSETVKASVSESTAPVTATVAEPKPQTVAPPVPVVKPAAESVAKPASEAAASSTSGQIVSEADLQQKIQYSGVLFMSKSSKRVASSNNAEAKAMLEQSKQKMNEAKAALAAHKLDKAQALVDESMRLFNAASRMVPSEDMMAEQKKRYETLVKEVEDARASHKTNYDRMVAKKGASAGVKYDVKEVDRLMADAKALAAKSDYDKAVDATTKASNLVNNAITQMLAGQEIRYEIKLDTPQGEYAYEHDRYLGYEELIPVAIESKMPNEGQMTLVNRNVETAKKMAAEADKTAKTGDYPTAIRMILDAQEKVRAALRIMGVNQ